jgi:hypothetical protein
MSNESSHEVKSASAVLAEDVICQSFIQSSSTLAYACLLIRAQRYDLAAHVLHSLESKQASRFKDMVFYLQAQIGIETGEYAMAKKRLVPRVHQHPNDMVALSLLECGIHREWMEWAKTQPEPEPAAAATNGAAATLDSPSPVSDPLFGNAQANAAAVAEETPVSASPFPGPEPVSVSARPDHFGVGPAPSLPRAASATAAASLRASEAIPVAVKASGSPDLVPILNEDLGVFQPLANDANTQAIVLWGADKDKGAKDDPAENERGQVKSFFRHAGLQPLVAMLSEEIPGAIQAACSDLEAGAIHKICFSFQSLTVTTFHAAGQNLGLVTGHINQSLLAIVRAENTFRKQAPAHAHGAAPSSRSAEYAPNE